MGSELQNGLGNSVLFHQLDSYPWDDDEEFQGGLRAILGSVQDPEQVEHLTLRAKCYYYGGKTGSNVDFDGYKQWTEEQKRDGNNSSTINAGSTVPTAAQAQAEPATSGGLGEAPKPASFAEICELIAAGKPIPGIKEIPDTILEGQASENQAEKRKKPWEKDSTSAESPSWMT